ncbi:SDR family oxidoreductase [Anaerosalibacter massiliensis]|uniref:SDR family oxidoreductase n=1 Tax=Anaerosalibacter massiliensis TaxID=1347392 RepID=A0A9X2S581_9FIRM|nr:SDR family oxidoreductase [Anaerosalibacter massiliensis]MCR2044054.1 SDR family oxidoreductase [Anaerosalibacter massiliensis]
MTINYVTEDLPLSLKEKNILVTGVSRSMGIGTAITKLLAEAGANVITHGYSGYDKALKYRDYNNDFTNTLEQELNKKGYSVTILPPSDLSEKEIPEKVIEQAISKFGYIDGLVLNHAYSVCAPIGEWTSEHIDAHLNTNVRATMLMIQAFANQLPKGKSGVITLFTSGQYLGPMIKEIAYAVSKEAVIGLCKQAAVALAPQNIRVNCINPGATDTGYLEDEDYKTVAKMFPFGRWGMPEDAARLVHFLHSDYARWITGEVIASEGGFRRDVILE